APQQFHGAAPAHVAPPSSLADSSVSAQSAREGGTWAVSIGINDYPGTENDLSSAVNDANDVVQALESLGVTGDHILELRDGQVNRSTLLQSVAWLANHAGPDAVAVFFYAGHVRKTQYGNEEIVTSDGSSVSDADLARGLDRVAANRAWIGIASCYGGGFTEVLDRPGRVLTAAAGANSLAYENSSIGRSYMVEYMVHQAIIEGRASATVETAFDYAVQRIQQEHPGREPVEYETGNGALDLRPPGAGAPPPQFDGSGSAPSDSQSPPTPAAPESGASGTGQHCTGKGLFRYCTN
ncbi:MAG TPA: caspase family protein, partial [Acidimicrobiales bacterium]|nr:caspase family protein [Acidimicrobiales bacterium]